MGYKSWVYKYYFKTVLVYVISKAGFYKNPYKQYIAPWTPILEKSRRKEERIYFTKQKNRKEEDAP